MNLSILLATRTTERMISPAVPIKRGGERARNARSLASTCKLAKVVSDQSLTQSAPSSPVCAIRQARQIPRERRHVRQVPRLTVNRVDFPGKGAIPGPCQHEPRRVPRPRALSALSSPALNASGKLAQSSIRTAVFATKPMEKRPNRTLLVSIRAKFPGSRDTQTAPTSPAERPTAPSSPSSGRGHCIDRSVPKRAEFPAPNAEARRVPLLLYHETRRVPPTRSLVATSA